jgi:2-polyprenyl-6-hydroxyphenyl methylase/3-demethylubiquinone-9 3-methyltransferase
MSINNEVYDKKANSWWNDDACGTLSTLRYFGNEVRFNYFAAILSRLALPNAHNKVLDIGCGGGYLSEEFARKGFQVTGIDPSNESILYAQKHAQDNNLVINYIHGYGENLPFESNSFPIVVCCDVLEHVSDLKKVIAEISRVLAPGGAFFFDTINRTLVGKLIIKATQEWKGTAFLEPNVHVYDMFIKPKELVELFKINGLISKEIKGMSPKINLFAAYFALRKCKQGKISFQELGKILNMQISNNVWGQYIGYAMKNPN